MTNSIYLNRKLHDKIADTYEKTHCEIYNPIEQRRIEEKLSLVTSLAGLSPNVIKVLDYGCGAGNLTSHFLKKGCTVTAADLSPKFIELIQNRYGSSGRLKTMMLNGTDLAGVTDESFDVVAAYSVLHHVPDYLRAIQDMVRVLRHGGVLYLDHELSDGYWEQSPEYRAFLLQAIPKRSWSRFLKPSTYINKVRHELNPKYRAEGDIHVFPDDHIEWSLIENTLKDLGVEIAHKENYLMYRPEYALEVFEVYRERCSDMKMLFGRKTGKG